MDSAKEGYNFIKQRINWKTVTGFVALIVGLFVGVKVFGFWFFSVLIFLFIWIIYWYRRLQQKELEKVVESELPQPKFIVVPISRRSNSPSGSQTQVQLRLDPNTPSPLQHYNPKGDSVTFGPCPPPRQSSSRKKQGIYISRSSHNLNQPLLLNPTWPEAGRNLYPYEIKRAWDEHQVTRIPNTVGVGGRMARTPSPLPPATFPEDEGRPHTPHTQVKTVMTITPIPDDYAFDEDEVIRY